MSWGGVKVLRPDQVLGFPAGMPDGGLITSAQALARLVDALLGGRLLSPPLLAAMMTPQVPHSKDVEQYGYGLELVVENGAVTIIGHGGADPGVSTMVAGFTEVSHPTLRRVVMRIDF